MCTIHSREAKLFRFRHWIEGRTEKDTDRPMYKEASLLTITFELFVREKLDWWE